MRPGIIIRYAWGSYIFNIIFHHCHYHDWLGDILPQRHFGPGTFCPTSILPQYKMPFKDAGTAVCTISDY